MAELIEFACLTCNKTFKKPSTYKNPKYCSVFCSNKHRAHNPIVLLTNDPAYLKEIPADLKERAVLVGDDYVDEYGLMKKAALVVFACKNCTFLASRYISRNQPKPVYCSMRCRTAYKKYKRPKPISITHSEQKKKATEQQQPSWLFALSCIGGACITAALVISLFLTMHKAHAAESYLDLAATQRVTLYKSVTVQDFLHITPKEEASFMQTYKEHVSQQNSNDTQRYTFIKTSSDGHTNMLSCVDFVCD